MRSLLRGLPKEALLARPAGMPEEDWGVEHELLAQLVEEVSVLSSDHRRKKPVEIPRPGGQKPAPQAVADGSNVVDFSHARNVLMQTRRAVRGGRGV